MTMNDTWGFKSTDHNWKSSETLIRNLVDIASKGGNYLLNVGPTSEGLIPEPSVERLKEVGRWMKQNGQSIYATTASPFKLLPWGRCTKKLHEGGATLYLHVFNWPADGKLVVPGLRNEITTAALLVAPQNPLPMARSGIDVVLTVPSTAPDAICSVVVLEAKGDLDIEPVLPAQAADGSIRFVADDAVMHGDKVKVEGGHRGSNIGFWIDPADWVEWPFMATKPGKYTVTAEIAAPGGGSFAAYQVIIGQEKLLATPMTTGDFKKYKTVQLGTIQIAATGKTSLALRPLRLGWQPMNLKSISLKPAK